MSDSTVRVLFLGNAGSALRSVRSIESSFGSLGRAAGIAGTAIAAGLVGGLTMAVKAAVDFDREMRNVNSIARLSEGQFKTLSKSVLALAKDTGQAPKTLAQGLYDIVSSGFKADQGIKILRISAKAATAGLTDTATATKAVVAGLNAYHLGAAQAGKVGDTLFQIVNKGVVSFDELAQQMGDLVNPAAQMGISLQEVGGAFATLTLQGGPAAEHATRVKQLFVSMLKPTDSLQKAFKEMGFESGQVALKQLGLVGVIKRLSKEAGGNNALIADWFPNVRALAGFLGLAGANVKILTSNVEAMGAKGSLAKAFAEQGKSIAVQWQKAKAGLVAAAIPIGQLLFPLLQKAAGGVETFARSIQTHMPEIKREFGDLARVSGDAGRGLLDFGRSAEGMSVVTGGAAAFGFAKIVTGIGGLVAGLSAINPLLGVAALGVGVLAGGMLYLYLKTHQVSQEFRDALRAIVALHSATTEQKQASLDLAAAQTNVKQAHLTVRQAIRDRNAAEAEAGRSSDRYKQAALNVTRAYQGLAQANLDVAQATDNKKDADTRAGNAARDYSKKINELAATHRHVLRSGQDVERQSDDISRAYYRGFNAAGKNASAQQRVAAGLRAANAELAKKDAVGYAADMAALAGEMQRAGLKTADFAKAAGALAEALGRIPTHKEVSIIVTEERRDRHSGGVGYNDASGGQAANGRGRAGGGFIPMSAGPSGFDSVPAMLTPGELVLNRAQQNVLGGPGFLANLFGFRGDEGPGFATGGFARHKPKRKRSSRSPHSKPRGRVHKVKAAKAAVAGVEKINQTEDDADRSYGQLVRQYDQTTEVFIRTDADGNDYISQPDIDQRVGEIDDLIRAREHMLDLLDDEKRELKQAIAKLRRAIAALVKAIRAERKAIAGLNRQIGKERKKKKPNQNLIGNWQNQISGHESNISDFQSTIGDFRSAIGDEQQNLNHSLPFDRRDVQLDIGALQSERTDVTGTKLPPGSGASGGTGDTTEALLRRIGALQLALGIQGVQSAIIGSFQKGTIHVPETGLALVHAGESITPSGFPRGGFNASGEGSPIEVHVVIEDGAVDASKIRAIAVGAHREIDLRIQQAQSGRLRSGAVR